MKIGILTFYKVTNFGANLQAISTYYCLKNLGHEVVFLHYVSKRNELMLSRSIKRNSQVAEHQKFIDQNITNQSKNLHNSNDTLRAILELQLDAVIIGSDAVVQHHPLFSTLKLGRHRPFWFEPLEPERRFPNPFWGYKFSNRLPTAMMSVSSQNSKYKIFTTCTKRRMGKVLGHMKYISVRDEWTKNMMLTVNPDLNICITPDPVFALNQNLNGIIPTEKDIRRRFNLPPNYVLVGLRTQIWSMQKLQYLEELLEKENKQCVAFPIVSIVSFHHPFKYAIPLPLSPLDWYAIIKYASGYVGSNMHPIVSSLANGVPCYSFDNWGSTNFWGKKTRDSSSKVYDILKQYGLEKNRAEIEQGTCTVDPKEVIEKLRTFPSKEIINISTKKHGYYVDMISKMLKSLSENK